MLCQETTTLQYNFPVFGLVQSFTPSFPWILCSRPSYDPCGHELMCVGGHGERWWNGWGQQQPDIVQVQHVHRGGSCSCSYSWRRSTTTRHYPRRRPRSRTLTWARRLLWRTIARMGTLSRWTRSWTVARTWMTSRCCHLTPRHRVPSGRFHVTCTEWLRAPQAATPDSCARTRRTWWGRADAATISIRQVRHKIRQAVVTSAGGGDGQPHTS